MDSAFAAKLCELNNRFYAQNAASFSATRTSPWDGWKRAVGLLSADGFAGGRVLDVACGNMRFEAFLAKALPEVSFDFLGVDSCPALLDGRVDARFKELDVVQALLEGRDLAAEIGEGGFDMSVSFGFMHHLPTFEMRVALLRALLASTRQGGYVVVSFWEFMRNEALARKARVTHAAALKDLALSPAEIAQLDENDFFLGWKDTQKSYRYCHNFTDAEIGALVAAVTPDARPIDRYSSDGRSNNLNAYVILQKKRS